MSKDNGETTPLHTACLNDNINDVRSLIDLGADVNLIKNGGTTCLLIACQNNNIEMVRLLLENHAKPNLKTIGGNTCLDIAARNGNIEMVYLLREYGAKIKSSKNPKKIYQLITTSIGKTPIGKSRSYFGIPGGGIRKTTRGKKYKTKKNRKTKRLHR